MSTFVTLEFQAKSDKVEEVKDFLKKVLPDTRAYEGFESIDLHQDQDEPTKFVFYEQWSSRPAYETYLVWRTETGALDEFVAMLVGPPSFRFFDLVDV